MILLERDNWDEAIIGKILKEDIVSEAGHFLLRKGTVISDFHLNLFSNHDISEIHVTEESSESLNVQLTHIFSKNDEMSSKYYNSVKEIKKLFNDAITREVPPLKDFMNHFEPLLEQALKGSNIFLELRHIQGHSEYTYRHSLNVGLLSAMIGKILRCSDDELLILGRMGFLHDIGKMKIPAEIIEKKGKLSKEEFNIIKMHPIYSKEILEKMEGVTEYLIDGALHHHERLDGTGYPHQLRGDEIDYFTQIVGVADTYDAISSDRVYSKKFTPFEALAELMQNVFTGKFNGEIVIPFVNNICSGYVGCEVLLSDGRKATIIHLPIDEINRPLLKINNEFLDLQKQRSLKIIDIF